MVVKDNKETSFEREASIAEIHWLPLDARIATIAEIENFSVSNARIAGNATIAGKQDKKTLHPSHGVVTRFFQNMKT